MSKWIIKKKYKKKPKLSNPILIEGLPGIGNVGKICVDFLIDSLKPEELYQIYSHCLPNTVFVNDDYIIELPMISLYALKRKGERDLLILSGDMQPMDEEASYEFSEKILDLAEDFGCKEVITIGGIGLSSEIKTAKVFAVATDKKTLNKYTKLHKKIKTKGNKTSTIMGAAGLIVGLSKLRKMTGVSLLSETFGHPYHLGLKESSAVLEILKDIFNLEINLKDLEKEISKEKNRVKKATETEESSLMKKLKKIKGEGGDTSYIG